MKTVEAFNAAVMNIDNRTGKFGFAHIDGHPMSEHIFFHLNGGRTVQEHGGSFCVDTHVHASCPSPPMPRQYGRIIITELKTNHLGLAAINWCHEMDFLATQAMHLMKCPETRLATTSGKVKFFNKNKQGGWGFIVMDGNGKDLYFEFDRGVQAIAGASHPELVTFAPLAHPQTDDRITVFARENDARGRSKAAIWCYEDNWSAAIKRDR